MPTIHVTQGLPASGKTTAALELVRQSEGRVRRVNLDSLRLMLDDNAGSVRRGRAHEDVVLAAQDAAILAAVDAGFDVVIDNTHLVPRLPSRYKRLLASRDVQFAVIDCTGVPVEECVQRDAERPGSIGEQLIRTMHERMLAAGKSGWRLTAEWMNDRPTVRPYVPTGMLPSAVLCDIDGTLAIHAGRGPYEIEKCETDLLNEEVARILALCDRAEDYVVLLSGRQSEFRDHTERWLKANGVVYDELWMRAEGDRRPDDVVKAELFDAHVRDRYDVRFVLDDRDRVVALWRRLGLRCWQVAPGNF
jgi:predicted kinase